MIVRLQLLFSWYEHQRQFRWFRILKRNLIPLVALFFSFCILDWFFPIRIPNHYSQVVLDSQKQPLYAFLTLDDKWRIRCQIDELSPYFTKAILHKEDQYFYYHWGVNPISLIRAFVQNVISGKRLSGASTITMQLARMIEPKSRTYFNKMIEVFRAMQLEFHYSKEEIFMAYVNLLPYGGNIEGIKSASYLYFRKAPSQLSLAEAVTLTVIPNRPTSLRVGKKNKQIQQVRDKWLKRFLVERVFDKHLIETALAEPVEAQRQEFPQRAPHFSIRLQKQFPQQENLVTFLNPQIQSVAEELTKQHIQRIRSFGIENACVLVVENRTRKVIAYVGSADFNDVSASGQVDGILSYRSPGSALKPFLYGYAIEMGLIGPKTVISDVPYNFSGYQPENYDKNFHAKVSIETALAQSLNIPAVKILNQLGVSKFTHWLFQHNLQRFHPKSNLGLSLILGGCEVNLAELVSLYCALANQGKFQKLTFLQSEEVKKEVQLLSAETSYILAEILSLPTRPDLPNFFQNSIHLPKIAWKTGTSYGRRDAWSIGFNAHYTIGVWCGNFNGQGSPALSGADIATPLLFKVFQAIDRKNTKEWLQRPRQLQTRLVCLESGLLPDTFCTSLQIEYYLPGISPSQRCKHKIPKWVNSAETISYCNFCLPEFGTKLKFYPNYEPELQAFYQFHRIPFLKVPKHNPQCTQASSDLPPQITSLHPGGDYFLRFKEKNQIALECQANLDVQQVHWFINHAYYKTAPVTETVYFQPTDTGSYQITCTDNHGRT
ncbi:MAG: penicillin-binding protein 1C, partial [Bacteroidia bacterium]|nr:penicillin-binding protein 1C [Bacteroidia bacterium]